MFTAEIVCSSQSMTSKPILEIMYDPQNFRQVSLASRLEHTKRPYLRQRIEEATFSKLQEKKEIYGIKFLIKVSCSRN